MPKRRLQGTIVSNKMQKTVVVRIERIKEHPKYKKRYQVSKKYKAHAAKGEYKVGDRVVIEECRPMSKEKRWQVIEKISPKSEAQISNQIIKTPSPLEGKQASFKGDLSIGDSLE